MRRMVINNISSDTVEAKSGELALLPERMNSQHLTGRAGCGLNTHGLHWGKRNRERKVLSILLTLINI